MFLPSGYLASLTIRRGCPAIRGSTKDSSSEDCLAINVWTRPQVGEKKKAVLVWFFGGGFSAGDSSDPEENGARFTKQQDVVLVSFNYRNNIFGFPGCPNLPDMNPGILDMRMAVEWVRGQHRELWRRCFQNHTLWKFGRRSRRGLLCLPVRILI